MRICRRQLLGLLALVLLCTACGEEEGQSPAAAQQSYGRVVSSAEATPVPAVAAEAARYAGHRVTVDGRISRVGADGCRLALDTKSAAVLRIEAPRSGAGCAWTVPDGTDGMAVATGTLRVIGDSLWLSANGVQVTPIRTSGLNR